jgi:hypothetical protein
MAERHIELITADRSPTEASKVSAFQAWSHLMPKVNKDRRREKLNFPKWCAAVDRRLKGVYAVTTTDLSIDESYLRSRWQMELAPEELAESIADRLNLDALPSHMQEK